MYIDYVEICMLYADFYEQYFRRHGVPNHKDRFIIDLLLIRRLRAYLHAHFPQGRCPQRQTPTIVKKERIQS